MSFSSSLNPAVGIKMGNSSLWMFTSKIFLHSALLGAVGQDDRVWRYNYNIDITILIPKPLKMIDDELIDAM
jgi:hypothetical protein